MHKVEDIEIIKRNKKYGLKNNITGKIILEPIYDLIEKWKHSDSYYFVSNPNEVVDIPDMYVIIKDKKIGFANEEGVVVEPIYDDLLGEDFVYQEKLYPVFVAVKDEKYAYIDKYGKPLTEFIYDDVDFPVIGPIAHVLNTNGMDEYLSLFSGKTFFSNPTSKDVVASVTPKHVAMLIENNRYKVFDQDGNCIVDFVNNENLNSAPIRYLNEKLLMYFAETEVSSGLYKIGLIDYQGNILTDMKYAQVKAITGTTTVLGTNLVGGLDELIDEKGNILLSKMQNTISLNGFDEEGRLISPLFYWEVGEAPMDFDKCLQVDEKLLSSKDETKNSAVSE